MSLSIEELKEAFKQQIAASRDLKLKLYLLFYLHHAKEQLTVSRIASDDLSKLANQVITFSESRNRCYLFNGRRKIPIYLPYLELV